MKMGDQEAAIGNGSNRNGRNSKRPKPKKVPQRGLGVAQLEKIRLEEEEKNDAANAPSLAVTSHPFAQHHRPYLFSNDSLYGHGPYNTHLNPRHHSFGTISSTPPNNAGDGNNLLSSTYIQKAQKSTMFFQIQNPSYEPMLMSPFGLIPRESQKSCSFSSSMANDVAECSSSAVLSSQTEPPSNQSPYGTYRYYQPDEAEKAICSKRPYPFSLQDPSNTSLNFKCSPFKLHRNSGSLVVTGNPSSRAENRTSDCDFLKLASPSTLPYFPSSKSKQVHTYQAESLKHNSTSPKVHTLDLDSQAQQQSFYMFFPETDITRDDPSTVRHRHETDKECLDLNLKL